jgi:hypothetical protein
VIERTRRAIFQALTARLLNCRILSRASQGRMRNLVDAICEPPRSEDNRASFEHDRVPELLRLIGQRDLVAPESSSARAGIGASAQPQASGLGKISASLGQGSEPFGPRRDNSKLRSRRETVYPYGDPLAAEALARSPRRQQALARQARESALQTLAAVRALAWPASRRTGEPSPATTAVRMSAIRQTSTPFSGGREGLVA